MSNLALLLGCGQVSRPIYVDDVFQSYTRTGTGASAPIVNGINLSINGGTVWTKARSAATNHEVSSTASGTSLTLHPNSTIQQTVDIQGLTAFKANGYTIGTSSDYNNATGPVTYVDWTFRNAHKFYTHSVVVKSAGSNATVDLSSLGAVGMVRVKRTDAVGSWYIWHKDLTAGNLLIGETTAAQAVLGHITMSGTTLTLVNGVIADGTYLVEGFAHDTSATGIIQCGSFTTDASGNATVNLGWETQYLMTKMSSDSPGNMVNANWIITDEQREFTSSAYPNILTAESAGTEYQRGININKTSTGFIYNEGYASQTYIYISIRRPNKPPTSGTQVYNAIARTGTGAAATVTGVGFAPDLNLGKERGSTGAPNFTDRLRGKTQEIISSGTTAEAAFANDLTSFNMDGISLGSGVSGQKNTNTSTYIEWFFRRAPGFFDEICTTGTGANKTEAHNLTKAPELWLHKGRSGATEWVFGSTLLAATEKIVCPSPAGKVTDATAWNSTYPTASVISFGTAAAVNTSAATYATYLWATLAGISKVGLYTGNGSSQTLNMGFSAGARFFLVVSTSAAGSFWVFDTVRGIVAATDFGLQLNSTAAETTSADAVDPDASGIIVNQEATCSINANGVSYLYLGIA